MSAEAYAAATAAAAARSARPRAITGAVVVSGATILSGVLTYAFHVLAARALGPAGYGHVAVLWAGMFLGAVVLYRPLEQTLSRAIADRRERDEEVRSVILGTGLVALGTFAVVAAAGAAGWSLLADRLFGGDRLLAAFLVAGVVLYGVAYLIRGLVGGLCWFGGYATALVGDSIVRLAVAAPLVLVASRTLAGAAVVAAALGGIVVPFALGGSRLRALVTTRGTGTRFGARTAIGFAAPAGVIAGADQLLVNGGPLFVAAGGGRHASRDAGIVFAATMLVRVAVYVYQGLAAVLLPNLTRLQASADAAGFRSAVSRTASLLLALGAAVVIVSVGAGPRGMQVLYGSGFQAGRLELGLLGVGVAFYLAASTCSQALLAVDSARVAAGAWAIAAVAFVAVYAVAPAAPLLRVSIAFALALLVDLVLLCGLLVRRTRAS